MAADILAVRADEVPVGADAGRSIVEIAVELARRSRGARARDTAGGRRRRRAACCPAWHGRKMSKSYGNTIPLFGHRSPSSRPSPVRRVGTQPTAAARQGRRKDADTRGVALLEPTLAAPVRRHRHGAAAATGRGGIGVRRASKILLAERAGHDAGAACADGGYQRARLG